MKYTHLDGIIPKIVKYVLTISDLEALENRKKIIHYISMSTKLDEQTIKSFKKGNYLEKSLMDAGPMKNNNANWDSIWTNGEVSWNYGKTG